MIIPSFLREVTLFKNLTENQAELVQGLLKEEKYQAGEKIVEEGAAGESLYIIKSGRVRVTRIFENEPFILTELGTYDFFGEVSLIDDSPVSASVNTLVETSVLKMTRDDFKALVSSNTELSAKLWESLARSLTQKIRKTGNLVKMYHGLNKALCEDEQFRQLYTSWNYNIPKG